MVGGDGRACARVGSRGPAARRSMSHRWHQTSVRVFFPRGEECVNEFPRVSRLKLFSYAVAALSNFFGPPSGSHGSSPGVNCRTVTVREYECKASKQAKVFVLFRLTSLLAYECVTQTPRAPVHSLGGPGVTK